jgi:hypothetical protein
LKLTLVGARYLVLSYKVFVPPLSGSPPPINPESDGSLYNYAFVYDMTLLRWGHLAIQHSDVAAEFSDFLGAELYPTKDSIHFLHRSGKIRVAHWGRPKQMSVTTSTPAPAVQESVLILGPFEVTANSEFTLHHVSIQGGIVDDPALYTPTVYVNGGLLTPLAGSTLAAADYDCRITTKVMDLAIVGGYTLHDVSLQYTKHGHR